MPFGRALSDAGLNERQTAQVLRWFPDGRVEADMSWETWGSRVLRIADSGSRYVVKAGSPSDQHIGREIAAHRTATVALSAIGCAVRLVHADLAANLLATTYLEGELVQGSSAEDSADTYWQAGRLLRAFHGQSSRMDPQYDSAARARALDCLEHPHRIDRETVRRTRNLLLSESARPYTTVPTHGDWQPRNWVIHRGEVRVIDFGRFAFRPAATDLCRLAAQQWRHRPDLELAFLRGYGEDPRDPLAWNVFQVCEAIGTAVWAHLNGDRDFEQQGLRMLAEALPPT